jgi:acetyl esterase/lipase
MHQSLTPRSVLAVLAAASLAMAADQASPSPSAVWAARAVSQYNTDAADIVYVTAGNYEVKLDVYRRKDVKGPQPTVIYIHGGGWAGGSRNSILYLLPK